MVKPYFSNKGKLLLIERNKLVYYETKSATIFNNNVINMHSNF